VVWNHRKRPEGGVKWPSRVEALMTAFAWEAADRERDVRDAVEAFAAVRAEGA